MSARDLIPRSRSDFQAPNIYHNGGMDPFMALRRDVGKLFDDVLHGFDAPSLFDRLASQHGVWPIIEFSENDKEIRIFAEVPGMEEGDIEVMLEDGVLTLRGEKKSETQGEERQFSERYYGRFERRLDLGREVDEAKVEASFHNGVLTVTLPKTEKARANAKRIPINKH